MRVKKTEVVMWSGEALATPSPDPTTAIIFLPGRVAQSIARLMRYPARYVHALRWAFDHSIISTVNFPRSLIQGGHLSVCGGSIST